MENLRLSEQGVRLLEQAKRDILNSSEYLNMHLYHGRVVVNPDGRRVQLATGGTAVVQRLRVLMEQLDHPPCETVHCIAGFVDMRLDKEPNPIHSTIERVFYGLFQPGVPYDKLRHRDLWLFFLEEWPIQMNAEYTWADSPQKRAEITCRAIDLFLKEYEVVE